MRTFTNTYIFVYIAIVVIITAALLSFVAEELKPMQERNVEIEKKEDILRTVGKAERIKTEKDFSKYVEDEFVKYFSSSIVVNSEGEEQHGKDAFEITKSLKAEFAKPYDQRNLPIFIYSKEDDSVKYVIPLIGKGLWGQIWGYIALDSDLNTVYGAVFDHAKETPGLGAEINREWYQSKFKNKQIFDENGNLVSIQIKKGGADPADRHAVDAISGGTVTSKGLETMLRDNLLPYEKFFKQKMIDNNE